MIHFKEQKEKRTKNHKQNLRDLLGTIKSTNIHIIRTQEKEVREKESQRIYEIMAENTPNLMKIINLYFQKDE